jgi:nucleotide-binding universal stress UspA family protein
MLTVCRYQLADMGESDSYRTILVPTDGSKQAGRAAETAIDLAKRHGATLHALYVMDMGDLDYVATPSDIAETRERLEGKGADYTEEVREMAAAADVDCVTDVRSGIAPEEIVEYAGEHDVDLIVMGKRGRSDPDKPLFGTITRRVVGESEVPVQLV